MTVVLWVIVAVFLTIMVPVSFFRLRRGGPGMSLGWIPRSLRPATNRYFDRHGWQKPYDEDGNRNPDRTLV